MELSQTLDRQAENLQQRTTLRLERARHELNHMTSRLANRVPSPLIEEKRLQGQMLERRLNEALGKEMTARQTELQRVAGVLRTLNPEATLARGYTITTDAEGNPITSAGAVSAGMVLRTKFQDGETESVARS